VCDPDRQGQRRGREHAEMDQRALPDAQRARKQMRVGIADQQRSLKDTIATDHTEGAPPSSASTSW